MNAWENKDFVAAVDATGRKKLVLCGLWTTICLAFPALSATEAGFEVYAVSDCSGDVNVMSHEMGMLRIVQAGGKAIRGADCLRRRESTEVNRQEA